jgi:sterol desaturase/sphingolipid hydroxylase (fatty acid hydroxylase superfamily)
VGRLVVVAVRHRSSWLTACDLVSKVIEPRGSRSSVSQPRSVRKWTINNLRSKRASKYPLNMPPHDRLTRMNEHSTEMASAAATMDSKMTTDLKESVNDDCTNLSNTLVAWSSILVWPFIVTIPLVLSSPYSPTSYQDIIPEAWYVYDCTSTPKPLGLLLGILAVLVGQIAVWIFFYTFKYGLLGREPISIQSSGARPYDFWEGLQTHVSQPEGFVLLVGYLAITWMLHLMPASYYSFQGTIQWDKAFTCLVIQDGIQYVMHLLEHVVSPKFYQASHKPHHRFTNPRLFDAFNGSLTDTVCMIIIPLYLTANIMRTCNVWTYMAFGSLYASWLTLIHSEYTFVWDAIFRRFGFGTPADHHVHHKLFKYNYGHLFMWFDQAFGTYRDPKDLAPKLFNERV